jgi:hypothetical protein
MSNRIFPLEKDRLQHKGWIMLFKIWVAGIPFLFDMRRPKQVVCLHQEGSAQAAAAPLKTPTAFVSRSR